MTKTTAQELQSGITFSPDPQSPMSAGAIVNVGSDDVTQWENNGWIKCDGSEYSQATYGDLFGIVGTKYNTGGETAGFFRVPNGPFKTDFVDLGTGIFPSSTSLAKGYCEQSLNGDWWFNINATGESSSLTAITVDLSARGLSFDTSSKRQQLSGGNNVSTGSATANSSTTYYLTAGSAGTSWGVSGRVLLTGKPTNAFVGSDSRFSTFDEALESIPMIKAYNDYVNGVVIGQVPASPTTSGTIIQNASYAASESVYGFVLANSIIQKIQDTAYSGSGATGILPLTNIPDGKYKVTVGCQYAYCSAINATAYIAPQVNGSNVSLGGGAWFVGVDDDGSVETEAYNRGYSGTLLIDLASGTNTFDLNITVTTNGILARPWYILEKLENIVQITNEWD